MNLADAWFRNREAVARAGGAQSRAFRAKQGLPQGGALSPLLFVCFLDNLLVKCQAIIGAAVRAPPITLTAQIIVFADDVGVVAADTDFPALERTAQAAVSEAEARAPGNCLALAPEKWERAAFSCWARDFSKSGPPPVSLVCCGERVTFKTELKLLGFGLDPLLRGRFREQLVRERLIPRLRALKLLAQTKRGAGAQTLLNL